MGFGFANQSPTWGVGAPAPKFPPISQQNNGAAGYMEGAYHMDEQGNLVDKYGQPVTDTNATLFPGQSSPGIEKLKQMHLAALNVGAMRPEQAQARTNALQQQLSAFAPMNRALTSMYGPQGGIDLEMLGRNPMGPGMLQTGQPNASIGLNRPGPLQQSSTVPVGSPTKPVTSAVNIDALRRLLMGGQ